MVYDKKTYQKLWWKEHPDYKKDYRRKNSEKILKQEKVYYLNNREEIIKRKKIYRQKPETKQKETAYKKIYKKEKADEIAKYNKQYIRENSICLKEKKKQYNKTPRGKIVMKRHRDKRRKEVDCVPLNEWEAATKNFVGHHLDKVHVLYVPEEIHKRVHHNVFTGKNMNTINEKAIIWYADYYGLV